MKKRHIIRNFIAFVLGLLLIVWLLIDKFGLGRFYYGRHHGLVTIENNQFVESAKELENPYRGMYRMYGVVIKDQEEDYRLKVRDYGDDTELFLMQVNLCRFSQGPISEIGLENIDNLFAELEKLNKQCIVRFLYDWDGKAIEAEPENMEIILNHMEQVGPILQKYKDMIFIHQGIFVGNCGEMNNSNYLSGECMRTLITQLAKVTDESTYLAVRTPVQWRRIVQSPEVTKSVQDNSMYAARLGLYNDGMMGTEQDYGTYGILSREEAGDFSAWNREEELKFQEMLCAYVPNGGEVVVENPTNDLENAIESMATMHVTYLNLLYDQAVYDKWKETVVSEESCFDGMDGYSYIERHLGYRLLIKDAALSYDFEQDILSVKVNLQNVGFAPMYRKPKLYIVLHNEAEMVSNIYQLEDDVRVLSGGNDRETVLTVGKDISLAGLDEGEYSVFFFLKDPSTEKHIQLAIEQEETEYGYYVGALRIESLGSLMESFTERISLMIGANS